LSKIRDEIARRSAEPLIEMVKLEAAKNFQEGFCLPRCGSICQSPCFTARMIAFVTHDFERAWLRYVRMN